MPAWCSRSTRWRKPSGVAEPGGRGVVPGHLVPPRAAERVLHDRQELDVGEAELGHVVGQLFGQVQIGQSRPPRAEVHLVDADRLLVLGRAGAGGQPVASRSSGTRSRTRRDAVAGGTSAHAASGSIFSRQPPSGPRMRYLYLSPGAASGTNSSHTPLRPIDRIGQPSCGPQPAKSPITRTPRALGAQTANATPPSRARAPSDRPQPLVPALADQLQVELAERRRVPVRVVDPLAVHVEPVVGDLARRWRPRRRPRRGCGSSGTGRRRPRPAPGPRRGAGSGWWSAPSRRRAPHPGPGAPRARCAGRGPPR